MYKMITAIFLLALSGVSVNAFSASHKEDVCHKGNDVSVAKSSIEAHMNHGDTMGECDEAPEEPEPETDAAVVMMRCEPVVDNGVVVVSASSSPPLDVAVILPIPPVDNPDCAQALAGLLNAEFKVRSITSGSAGAGGTLHLYTDYLLIGEVPGGS